MDEAFKAAQNFGEAFEQGVAEGFHHAGRWRNCTDFYPHYSYPPANIYLTKEKNLIFEIALAGFEEKDINLQFRGDHLYFSARAHRDSEPEPGVQYFKKRLKLRDIEDQRYYVPQDKFDQEKVEASFKNGLLKITIPALEDVSEQKGVKININTEDG